jgi:hypothetical protein
MLGSFQTIRPSEQDVTNSLTVYAQTVYLVGCSKIRNPILECRNNIIIFGIHVHEG